MLKRTPRGVQCTECQCVWESVQWNGTMGHACACDAITDLCDMGNGEAMCRNCLTFKGDGVSHYNVCDGHPEDDTCGACGDCYPVAFHLAERTYVCAGCVVAWQGYAACLPAPLNMQDGSDV